MRCAGLAGALHHLFDAPHSSWHWGSVFDSNADSNADELWRTLANDYELLTPAVNFKMNAGER
jgi:hypothetical protein